tara:strand:- start:429 stop:590 length:162 start_codon:yes stop_codon:yes gene_type:complete
MSNNFNMQMEFQISKILQDYWDKLISKKELYQYLSNYGFDKKRVNNLIRGTNE